MLEHCRVTPKHVHFYRLRVCTWVERGTESFKSLAQEHNTVILTRARTQTSLFRVQGTKIKPLCLPTQHVSKGKLHRIKQFLIFREWMSIRCRDHYSTLFQTVRFFLISIIFSHITDILAQIPNLLNVISSSTVLHVQSAPQILQTVSLVVPEMSNAPVRQIWTKH